MKALMRNLLYPVVFALVFFFAWQTLAQGAGSKALVIVRFNQARVYYDQALYQAISQAVSVKPGVLFEVVAYSPETGDSSEDERWQELAGSHTRQVVNSMNQMGVPMSRIKVSGQRMAGLQFDETHVFVK